MHIKKDSGRQNWFISMSYLFMLFMFTNTNAATAVNAFDKAVDHPPIPLLDEQGNHVLDSTKPYSPKKSCEGSGCHDYEAITHAYHFEMGRDEASDNYGAKRGLPHLVSPGYYGGYTCMGGSTQQVLAKKNNASINEFADYGSAGWVKTCMTCHVGGGWAEKDREGIRYDEKDPAKIKMGDGDYYERHTAKDGTESFKLWDWKKSGVGEADCIFCHVDFTKMDLPTRERHGVIQQRPRDVRREFNRIDNFRGAATGFLAYVSDNKGEKLVSVKRNDDKKKTLFQDDNDQPVFNWNEAAFDENGRTTIPMLRFPGNANCMACHTTSNSRRGFYGFGESAAQRIDPENIDDGVLEDDYQDDIHKGKVYVDDNGQSRTIETCNACHAKQYFKSNRAPIDLDANHDFPKGNSDMDVRNDLDYAPNAKSCEECHQTSKNPIVPSGHDNLLNAHRELWKGSGDMAGYSKGTLTKITQTHFDVVSCQACHINGKKNGDKPIQILFRYRVAEDGRSTMMPYNPRVRTYWKDANSGRVLVKNELAAIAKKFENKEDSKKSYLSIIDVTTDKELGRVQYNRRGRVEPETYEQFMFVKKAYEILLNKKGVANARVVQVLIESNEYVISHNTRASPDSVQCEECHERKQSGAFSSLVSPKGIMGRANEKKIMTVPDPRLVAEGHFILGLPYMKLKENGDVVINVEDILFDTKIDPFMTIFKNSSATENVGEFIKIPSNTVPAIVGAENAGKMAGDLPSQDSYLYSVKKGDRSLRSMSALIDGNTVNSILFPTYRGALGMLKGAVGAAEGILSARGWGELSSDVFYFEVRDAAKGHIPSFNGARMFVKVAYKGSKSDANSINVVVANWALSSVEAVPASDIIDIQAAGDQGEGYVIFRMNEPGYFIVADK